MGRFSFFWNRNSQEKEQIFNLQSSTVTNEQMADAQQTVDPYEAIRQQEREKVMLSDERTTQLIEKHPYLEPFGPAMAPVNRTTKHISRSDAKVMWLNFQILECLVELGMHPADFEDRAPENIQGLEMQYDSLISDGFEGWKGRILTEQKKTIRSEFGKGK